MRLIDADALKERFVTKQAYFAERILEKIDTATTIDAIPVIRCKDCKHYQNGICNNVGGLWDDYEFCSDADRKVDYES